MAIKEEVKQEAEPVAAAKEESAEKDAGDVQEEVEEDPVEPKKELTLMEKINQMKINIENNKKKMEQEK